MAQRLLRRHLERAHDAEHDRHAEQHLAADPMRHRAQISASGDARLHRHAHGDDAGAVEAVDDVARDEHEHERGQELEQADEAEVPGAVVRSYICQPSATSSIWLAVVPGGASSRGA